MTVPATGARRNGAGKRKGVGGPSPLLLHVAGWPGRCVDCQRVVRRGEAMAFRKDYPPLVRWCSNCVRTLAETPTPTREYLSTFGASDVLLAALARRGGPPDRARDWRQEITDVRNLTGRRVRLRRGAAILSDSNPHAKASATLQRSQTVKVFDVLAEHPTDPTAAASVRWAGAGGYLREVALNDVEGLQE